MCVCAKPRAWRKLTWREDSVSPALSSRDVTIVCPRLETGLHAGSTSCRMACSLVQLNAVSHVGTGIVVLQDDSWSYPLSWGTTVCHAMGGAVQHFLSSCCIIDFIPVNKWYAFEKKNVLFLFAFPSARFWTEELLYRQNDVTRAFLLVQGWTKRQYKDIVLTEDKSGRYWCSSGNNIENILKEALLAPLCGFRRLQN